MPDATLRDRILRPVRESNVFESTVEHLASAVRLGVLIEGEKLPPERELAARLGVSRVTLRAAIAALRDSGLVSTRPGRGGGTVVTYDPEDHSQLRAEDADLTAAGVRDALDFRRVVEPGAAYLAAQRPTTEREHDRLRSLEAVVRATDSDRHAHRVADARLHLAVASLCGSPTLIEAVARAQESLRLLLAQMAIFHRNISSSHAQHRALVSAVIRGDPHAARAVTEEHCDATAALLRGLVLKETS